MKSKYSVFNEHHVEYYITLSGYMAPVLPFLKTNFIIGYNQVGRTDLTCELLLSLGSAGTKGGTHVSFTNGRFEN